VQHTLQGIEWTHSLPFGPEKLTSVQNAGACVAFPKSAKKSNSTQRAKRNSWDCSKNKK
jgi:hypothetical protein